LQCDFTASEAMTLGQYRNVCIIIIIIVLRRT